MVNRGSSRRPERGRCVSVSPTASVLRLRCVGHPISKLRPILARIDNLPAMSDSVSIFAEGTFEEQVSPLPSEKSLICGFDSATD